MRKICTTCAPIIGSIIGGQFHYTSSNIRTNIFKNSLNIFKYSGEKYWYDQYIRAAQYSRLIISLVVYCERWRHLANVSVVCDSVEQQLSSLSMEYFPAVLHNIIFMTTVLLEQKCSSLKYNDNAPVLVL